MTSDAGVKIRELLLQVVNDKQPRSSTDSPLQRDPVFQEVMQRLGRGAAANAETEILTQWHELVCSGVFAWGFNLSNPNPPFFHITERGRAALATISRDPYNPAGYMRYLDSVSIISPIARSYLAEALSCLVTRLDKAAAVMLGAANECLLLELRDLMVAKLNSQSKPVPKGLQDWRIKAVVDALNDLFIARSAEMPRELRDEFDAYWTAFAQQIRTTRNDAGHPKSVTPVTEDSVHAAFLAFPLVAQLNSKLSAWISI
jgi:hypothetical protein